MAYNKSINTGYFGAVVWLAGFRGNLLTGTITHFVTPSSLSNLSPNI